MDVQDELRPRLRSAACLAVAIVVSLFVIFGFVEFLRFRFKPFVGFSPETVTLLFRYAFFGAAVASVVLIRGLRRTILKKAAQDDARAALDRLQRASLLTLVLSEIPGILGFILFLIGGLNIDFYILVFVSLFLVFMYFPRRSAWEEWLRA